MKKFLVISLVIIFVILEGVVLVLKLNCQECKTVENNIIPVCDVPLTVPGDLEIDGSGNPHVLMRMDFNLNTDNIKYRKWDGAAWTAEDNLSN